MKPPVIKRKRKMSHSYWEEMKPAVVMLQAMGRFPCRITNEGVKEFSFCSLPMVYSLLYYGGNCALSVWNSINIVTEKIEAAKEFGELVFWILIMMFGVQTYLLPVSYWWDAPRTAAYFAQWKQFQEFVRIDGFKMQGVRKVRIATYSALPITLSFLTVNKFIFSDLSAFVLIQFVPLINACILTLVIWSGTLYEISVSSRSLGKRIAKSRCVKELEYLRQTHLKLNELAVGLGTALGASLITISLVFFTCFVLCVYTLLVGRQENSWSIVFGLTGSAILNGFPILLLAETGHRANEVIHKEFCTKIIKIDVSQLSDKCATEIRMMLEGTMVLPPILEYNGFVAANRHTLVNILGSVVTYLIVLVQFNTKPSSENVAFTNNSIVQTLN